MTDLKPLSLGELMAWTGDGPKKVRRLIRQGQLPGTVDKYGKYRCTPKDAIEWRSGEWSPRLQPEPISLLHKRSA